MEDTVAAPRPKPKPPVRRARHPMPANIRRALTQRGLMSAYRERPAYQQNDYLGWIARAVRDATQQRRLDQMLDELAAGDVYMKMVWSPRRL